MSSPGEEVRRMQISIERIVPIVATGKGV